MLNGGHVRHLGRAGSHSAAAPPPLTAAVSLALASSASTDARVRTQSQLDWRLQTHRLSCNRLRMGMIREEYRNASPRRPTAARVVSGVEERLGRSRIGDLVKVAHAAEPRDTGGKTAKVEAKATPKTPQKTCPPWNCPRRGHFGRRRRRRRWRAFRPD